MLDYALLDALAAVVRHGSFDRAASELNRAGHQYRLARDSASFHETLMY